MTPSAAYGLALNLAGVEMRQDDGKLAMTLIRARGLPKLDVALGAPGDGVQWKWGGAGRRDPTVFPRVHEMYQQLHNYPPGTHGRDRASQTKGAKHNITPVRRSVLSGLAAVACFRLEGSGALERRVRAGLSGDSESRYGLPFLGDNNLLPDHIELLEGPPSCHWFVPIISGDGDVPCQGVGRLTVTIDRADSSRTRSSLFGPTTEATSAVPDSAWVRVDYTR
jgi:CRISPR-associated protein Cas5t